MPLYTVSASVAVLNSNRGVRTTVHWVQKRRLKWLWGLLGAAVVIVAIPFILFGFVLFQNEPSPFDELPDTAITANARARDESFLGVPYPVSATLFQRGADERGIDDLLAVRFETNESDAVAYVQKLTGRLPEPGFSIQDLDFDWWKQRPARGRGAASDPAVSSIVKRVLLSEPDPTGNTTVWIMANET
jgi:hypothetical protein